MTTKTRLSLFLALAGAALLSVAALAGARPRVIDNYCSESGDFCQSILLSKKGGQIKFELVSVTAAVQGEYTLCVKGESGKQCKEFFLEQLPDEEAWADKVNWEENFREDLGEFVVKWKYLGNRLGEKLRFGVGGAGEA